jgi:hypothetical protein
MKARKRYMRMSKEDLTSGCMTKGALKGIKNPAGLKKSDLVDIIMAYWECVSNILVGKN